jgi:hypothetical protein
MIGNEGSRSRIHKKNKKRQIGETEGEKHAVVVRM